jgi:hypothetical protein
MSGTLLVGAVVIGLGYWISLRIHPEARCRTCNGTGRHWGSMYTRSLRGCRSCGGRGRKERLGVKLLRGTKKLGPARTQLRCAGDWPVPTRPGTYDSGGASLSPEQQQCATTAAPGKDLPRQDWLMPGMRHRVPVR